MRQINKTLKDVGSIFSYSIVSGIILIFLYIAYKLTMAGERQFNINRAVIYAIYALALVLPAAYPALKSMEWGSPQIQMSPVEVVPELGTFELIAGDAEIPVWSVVLLWIYLAGVCVASVRLIASISRIIYIAKSKGSIRLDNGYILVLTDDRMFSPFSFMRYIIISREDYEKCRDVILTHEITHLRQHHWIDQIAANLVAIFQWYNPASWLMIEELKTIHEYQADSAVIESGADIRHYQYLLIEKAVGKRFPSPANSLNHSKLKKRVTMMYKSKPSKMRRMAAIAVIPAAIVAIAITDIPAVAEVISETGSARLSSVSDAKFSDFSSSQQEQKEKKLKDEPLRVVAVGVAKKNPDGTYGKVEKVQTLTEIDEVNVVAPANPELKFKAAVTYADDADIYIDGVKSTQEALDKIDRSTIKSITVNQQSKPAQVRVTLRRPGEKETQRDDVFQAVDEQAQFPGGIQELMKYLSMNVRYPYEAMKNNIQGRVIVKFIVTKDGKIESPEVLRGVDKSLDDEAKRVVQAMPAWTPAKNNGKPVDSFFTLPVNFRLQEIKQPEKTDSISKQ